jgi:hypothetical protein
MMGGRDGSRQRLGGKYREQKDGGGEGWVDAEWGCDVM